MFFVKCSPIIFVFIYNCKKKNYSSPVVFCVTMVYGVLLVPLEDVCSSAEVSFIHHPRASRFLTTQYNTLALPTLTHIIQALNQQRHYLVLLVLGGIMELCEAEKKRWRMGFWKCMNIA